MECTWTAGFSLNSGSYGFYGEGETYTGEEKEGQEPIPTIDIYHELPKDWREEYWDKEKEWIEEIFGIDKDWIHSVTELWRPFEKP